ncbi:hypothetical protein JCM16138_09710 [Thermococcus atlanticus]
MACIIIEEITEGMIGVVMLIGFFSRKFALLHGNRASLAIGLLFLIAPLIEVPTGVSMEFLEFSAALLLFWVVEKFMAINLKKHAEWKYIMVVSALTLIFVFIKGSIDSFQLGVLMTMTLMPLRASRAVGLLLWPYREIFYLSAVFGFLAVAAYLLSLNLLSDFLYFGGVLLFLSVIPELGGT